MSRPLLRSVVTLVPALVFARPAAADPLGVCLDAAAKAQTLRDTHKLLEAREQLRACAAASCPVVVQTDCAGWLADVERGLPTVVFAAKDAGGRDVLDAKVTVDGRPLAAGLDGTAVPMNPGPHRVRVEWAGGAAVERSVLVIEGAKNLRVSVVLNGPPQAPPGTGPSTAPSGPKPSAANADAGPWKTLGWSLGGAGVVGLAVGGVFGLKALSDKSSANCDTATHACDAGPLADANRAATVSTLGFVAGGVLLAGGVALVLLSAKGGATAPAAALRLAPGGGVGGGGLLLAGTW